MFNFCIVCLPDGALLDGYTRYEVLQELGIPITEEMLEVRDIPNHNIRDEVVSARINRSPSSHRSRLSHLHSERLFERGRGREWRGFWALKSQLAKKLINS